MTRARPLATPRRHPRLRSTGRAVVSLCLGLAALVQGFAPAWAIALPDPPDLTQTDPVSPSSDPTPRVEGTAEADSTVKLYTDDQCTGTPVAEGTASAGGAFSIEVTLATDDTYVFYATATNGFGMTSDCSTPDHVEYRLDRLAPDPPTVTGPPSPASGTSITVNVVSDEPYVTLYATEDCSGTPLYDNVPPDAGTAAFSVVVSANATSTFSATATDAAGNVSVCSEPYAYTEDSLVATPEITASDPASPADNESPTLQGTTDPDTTVTIHLAPDCSDDLGWSGSAADFTGAGIQVAAGSGTTTTFYAKATDGVGNVSGCSAGFEYVELNPSTTTQFDSATLYLGWKTSDDINTAVDLRVEFFSGATSLGHGETYCFRGLRRDLSRIKAVEVPLDGVGLPTGSPVTVRVFARIGTDGKGVRCTGTGATHTRARGVRFYYDTETRGSVLSNASRVFFTSDGTTCTSALSSGVSIRTFDGAPGGVLHCQDSTAISIAGGNIWQQIGGDWTLTLP